MSTSIRQKITLFTLVPAVIFYTLVTVVYLYYTYSAATAEISRRHLHQSLQYASVVNGNVREVLQAGKALQFHINRLDDNYQGMDVYLRHIFQNNRLVTAVGIIHENTPNNFSIKRRKEHYWLNQEGHFLPATSEPPSYIMDHDLFKKNKDKWWYTSTSYENENEFRTSLLLPLSNHKTLRIDIDGNELSAPLKWLDSNTRLIIMDRNGVSIYSNGISTRIQRHLTPFIVNGPCNGFSTINITSEEIEPAKQFISNPIRSSVGVSPCSIYQEALYRVTEHGQSINFRAIIRQQKKWVTATPIPVTGWYLSISILEKELLAPLIQHAILSISLIALAMVLTLIGLWAVSGRITRPLNKLKLEMNAYAGIHDTHKKAQYRDESVSLNRSFQELRQHLADRDRALQQARANNMGHLVQQLRGRYFYFNLSRDHNILFVSPSIVSVLGYEPQDFTGNIQYYLTSSTLNQRFTSTLGSLTAGLWQEPFEVEMRHKNGSVRRIEMFCANHDNYLSDAMINDQNGLQHSCIEGMANDITHRIKDTEKFKSLIAGSPDATIITNHESIIGLVNKEIINLFSYTEEELINMPLSILVEPTSRSKLILIDTLNPDQPEAHCLDSFLSVGLSKSGRCFPVEISSNVLNTSDGILISIVFRDISERVRIQKELISAKELAETASKTKSMFLSNISHELRTPLNGVLGYAQLLLSDKTIPPRHLSNLKVLEECGLHLLTLINNILDLTKIESSGIKIDHQPYNIRNTINTTFATVQDVAVRKNIKIIKCINKSIAHEIMGDSIKISQVLINLLGNAIKFTEVGTVTLNIYNKKNMLYFEVIDTGIGIAKNDIPKIFQPFSQLKSGLNKEGTGLGLTISKRLVKAMKGELKISSHLNKGSCFHFMIPYHPIKRTVYPQPQILSINDITSNTKNSKILIVDDNFVNRKMLEKSLKEKQYCVETADNGSNAIEMCKKTHYDLILMDIRMPKIDGITAAKIIHKLPTYKSLDIIAISASVSHNTKKEIKDSGFCSFISKPIHLKSLFDQIEHFLNKKTINQNSLLSSIQRKNLIKEIKHSLDIGDIENLHQKSLKWNQEGIYGYYAYEIIKHCEALDINALEKILDELKHSE